MELVQTVAAVLALFFAATGPMLRDEFLEWRARIRNRTHRPWSGLKAGVGTRKPSAAPRAVWAMLSVATALTLIGVTVNQLPSHVGGRSELTAHLVFVSLGVPLMLLGVSVPPRIYRRMAPFGLLAGVLLLSVVLMIGPRVMGRRVVSSVGAGMRAGDVVVFMLVLWIAAMLVRRRSARPTSDVVIAWLVLAVGIMLLRLPELNAGLGVGAVSLVMFLTARSSLKSKLVFAYAMVSVLTLFLLVPYRRARLLSPLSGDLSFAASEARRVVGAGGVFGQGLDAPAPPVPGLHDEFVLALVGYRIGWFGLAICIALLLSLVALLVWMAAHADDLFARLVPMGIATWIFLDGSLAVLAIAGWEGFGPGFPLVAVGTWGVSFRLLAIAVVASLFVHAPSWRVGPDPPSSLPTS